MSGRKAYILPKNLTVEQALDLLDVDTGGLTSYRYEKRGAIMKLRQVLNCPIKLRYGYKVKYEIHRNDGVVWKYKKESAVQRLESETLKHYMRTGPCGSDCKFICVEMVITDKWKNDKEIYRGNDYDEFRKICVK